MKTVSRSVKIKLNDKYYLLEEGDKISVSGTRLEKMEEEAGEEESKRSGEVIVEAAVHRRYLLVSCNNEEDRCFSPSSANDNYMLYFLDRLCNSKRFNNRSYNVKVVKKIPKGCRKMSLETFLKELIPVPEKKS